MIWNRIKYVYVHVDADLPLVVKQNYFHVQRISVYHFLPSYILCTMYIVYKNMKFSIMTASHKSSISILYRILWVQSSIPCYSIETSSFKGAKCKRSKFNRCQFQPFALSITHQILYFCVLFRSTICLT